MACFPCPLVKNYCRGEHFVGTSFNASITQPLSCRVASSVSRCVQQPFIILLLWIHLTCGMRHTEHDVYEWLYTTELQIRMSPCTVKDEQVCCSRNSLHPFLGYNHKSNCGCRNATLEMLRLPTNGTLALANLFSHLGKATIRIVVEHKAQSSCLQLVPIVSTPGVVLKKNTLFSCK